MTKPKRYCTIEYMDGRTLEFIFESLRDEEDPTRNAALEGLEGMRNLVVELDAQLMIIPMANVRSISLSPSPAKLLAHIVRGRIVAEKRP